MKEIRHLILAFINYAFVIPLTIAFFFIGSFVALRFITEESAQEPTTNRSQLETEQFRDVTKMVPDTLSDWNKLIIAIALTESRLNPDAIGKAGDSGILQIRECYVAEVNRLYGTHYTIEDAFNPETAIELFLLLQQHYNPNGDIDTAIYYHNKSPQYAKRVKQNLEFIERYEEFRKVLSAYLTSFE